VAADGADTPDALSGYEIPILGNRSSGTHAYLSQRSEKSSKTGV